MPGTSASAFFSVRDAVVERLAIRRLHRELIQALAHLTADADRRRVLHVDLACPAIVGQLRPQLRDDVVGQLGRDRRAASGGRRSGRGSVRRACWPRCRRSSRRALRRSGPARMMSATCALILDQLVVRRALRRFGGDRDLIGVLIGNEALRHERRTARAVSDQHHRERRHRRRPVAQDDLQRAVVAAQHAVERRAR